ncbi:MAG TPA: glycosyltransferase family 4 protein [Solirubrobacteraceae bacterium]|nr:glycosyltransferase family 4 protein [Solirubrobacteraceae bacterium]
MKPVLFITGHVPAYRAGALECLHEREEIEVALFGGRSVHGGPGQPSALPFPNRAVAPRELWGLASSGRYRAVVCSTAGRVAPVAGWAGARRARVPVILWASLWAHPRTAAHAVGYPALRHLYSSADAVVTYGPHVSEYVRARGARNVHVAPQSVDNDFWRGGETRAEPLLDDWPREAATRFLFVGRDAPEKGLDVLEKAWLAAFHSLGDSALVLAGGTSVPRRLEGTGTVAVGALEREQLRDVYAACHALIVPSTATSTFREPWGLVVNEAMNKELAVISSDAVGAAAGGLVRDDVDGLIVPAGDSAALAGAIERLAGDPQLSERLGAAGAREVLGYSHEAWAEGFSEALSTLGLSRTRW